VGGGGGSAREGRPEPNFSRGLIGSENPDKQLEKGGVRSREVHSLLSDWYGVLWGRTGADKVKQYGGEGKAVRV